MKRLTIYFSLIYLSFFLAVCNAEEPDWSSYGQLLASHVSAGMKDNVNLMTVNYTAVKADENYQLSLDTIANFDTNKLQGQNEKLAFYINAYNILAIKMVLDHWPVKSIKDAGSLFSSVWKKDVGKINQKTTSLHKVEHEILRKMAEPRIHMAIVCASVSCPDLRNEPYTSQKLSNQLDDQTQQFLKNDKKGLKLDGNTIIISKIFDWFEDDFDNQGGVKAFIRKFREDLPANIKIDADLSYNWNLNNR